MGRHKLGKCFMYIFIYLVLFVWLLRISSKQGEEVTVWLDCRTPPLMGTGDRSSDLQNTRKATLAKEN